MAGFNVTPTGRFCPTDDTKVAQLQVGLRRIRFPERRRTHKQLEIVILTAAAVGNIYMDDIAVD